MVSKNSGPVINHGTDIVDDEWEEPEKEEVEKTLNDILPLPKDIEYEKRYDPAHPYCTNWPTGSKKEEE